MSTNAPATDSKALAVAAEADTSPTRFAGINRDQLDLLKRTIAKGTTDDEFSLFMNTSTRLGIDPFARQIYAVKRWSPDEQKEVMAIQIGIDGFRAIADATDDYQGQEGPFWCGEDGEWKEAWISEKPPAAAKVTVYRKGVERGFVGVARYRSFVQTKKDGGPVRMWASMPDVMLAKCAEAQALRKAFPRQLSGVQTDDEMGQAGDPVPAVEVSKLPPPPAAVQASATATASAPAQQPPKAQVDTWPAFVADLATEVAKVQGLAEHVVGNVDVTTWVEKEVEAAIGHLLDTSKTERDCTEKLGRWITAVSKHAGASKTNRVALLKAGFEVAYKKRVRELREAATQADGAPA